MANNDFIAYIGDPDIHDGHIINVEQRGQEARIRIEGGNGRHLTFEFHGVTWTKLHRAEGMMLYGLAEFQGDVPVRHFVFVNWDEEDEAFLEIEAEEFSIIE